MPETKLDLVMWICIGAACAILAVKGIVLALEAARVWLIASLVIIVVSSACSHPRCHTTPLRWTNPQDGAVWVSAVTICQPQG